MAYTLLDSNLRLRCQHTSLRRLSCNRKRCRQTVQPGSFMREGRLDSVENFFGKTLRGPRLRLVPIGSHEELGVEEADSLPLEVGLPIGMGFEVVDATYIGLCGLGVNVE